MAELSGANEEKLPQLLVSLGVHLEAAKGDTFRLEYDPNRPDYSTDYGLARAIRGKIGRELGEPKHNVTRSGWMVQVDPSVRQVRPFVVALLATGLRLDDETVRQLIGMQEDLHDGMGRKRKKLAIGLHNADVITPPLEYTTAGSDFSFIPLGSSRAMSARYILRNTETGRRYSKLVEGSDKFPILKDVRGVVLSLPPIINGSATVVTSKTRNLFLDITGNDMKAMEDALAIVSETLWDAGAEVKSVGIKDGRVVRETPSLRSRTAELTKTDVTQLLGIEMTLPQIARALKRARLGAAITRGKVIVSIPAFRVDILHRVDLVEEVGYGVGFEKLKPDTAFSYSKGGASKESVLLDAFRKVALGLGMQEVVTFVLKSSQTQFEKVLRDGSNALKVESSKTKLYEYLRDSLAPGLLEVFENNVHESYPQRIFEIGRCFKADDRSETGVREELKVAGAVAAESAPFSEIRSIVDALLEKTFGQSAAYTTASVPYLIEGRAARFSVGGNEAGYLGEVKPEVLRAFKVKMPAVIFEFSLEVVAGALT